MAFEVSPFRRSLFWGDHFAGHHYEGTIRNVTKLLGSDKEIPDIFREYFTNKKENINNCIQHERTAPPDTCRGVLESGRNGDPRTFASIISAKTAQSGILSTVAHHLGSKLLLSPFYRQHFGSFSSLRLTLLRSGIGRPISVFEEMEDPLPPKNRDLSTF